MTTHRTKGNSRAKEIRAWGIRRRQVDISQLALAYYLLARVRIEEQRKAGRQAPTGDLPKDSAPDAGSNPSAGDADDTPEAA